MAIAELEKRSLYSEIRKARQQEEPQYGNDSSQVGWSIYGSGIDTYIKDAFWPILSREELGTFIQARNPLVVVDFMASSSALASLFKNIQNVQKTGLAVSLEDHRDYQLRIRDRYLGIEQITGDLTEKTTWKKLEQALNGNKADLILERAAGGLGYLPAHRRFFAIVLRKTWQLLSPAGGMMLIQTPKVGILNGLDIDMYEWEDLLLKNQIEATYYPYSSCFGGALGLVKTVDSPPQLPLL